MIQAFDVPLLTWLRIWDSSSESPFNDLQKPKKFKVKLLIFADANEQLNIELKE